MTAVHHVCHKPDEQEQEQILLSVAELHGLLGHLGGESRGSVDNASTSTATATAGASGPATAMVVSSGGGGGGGGIGGGVGGGTAATLPVSTRRTRSNSVMTVDSVQSQAQTQQTSQSRKKQKVVGGEAGGAGGGEEENDDDVTYWREVWHISPSPPPSHLNYHISQLSHTFSPTL